MAEALITLENVTKIYTDGMRGRVKAVDNLSLDIYEGESLGLVGESGCGKSTTGNMIVHLLKPDSGQILWRGTPVSGLSERAFRPYRSKIQMVFQDPAASLNHKKKIGWLLEEPLAIHRKDLSREERRKRAADMLDLVGLNESYANRYPGELSGGQRQRVSIALALILEPEFVVADEAVSALDVSVQAQILNLMKELQRKLSLTYLFISHNLNVVSWMSDRIGVMYLGNLVEIGSREQVCTRPAHPYTRALFDSTHVLEGEVPSPSNPPSGCPFHSRCSCCRDKCRTVKPKLTQLEKGRSVACHFPES